MKTITAKSSVETYVTASMDGKHTYSVRKTLNGIEGGKAVIVLLYPTRNVKNVFTDDSTMTHLTSHMPELGINDITIINLFSNVVKSKLSARGLEVDADNLSYIEKEIMSKPDFKDKKFIVAWGQSMLSCMACNDSKRLIVEMFRKNNADGMIYQLATKAMPDEKCPHPLYLGIRQKTAVWYLTECKCLDEATPDTDNTKQSTKPKKKTKQREFVYLDNDNKKG